MLRRLRDRHGSVLVEFALVAPLLILVLLGIMVMGVIINSKIVVAGAAREAGRTYSIAKDEGRARARAADAINSGGLKVAADGRVLFSPGQDVQITRSGDFVTVGVSYRQPTFIPLIAQLIDPGGGSGGYLTLRSQATFRVER